MPKNCKGGKIKSRTILASKWISYNDLILFFCPALVGSVVCDTSIYLVQMTTQEVLPHVAPFQTYILSCNSFEFEPLNFSHEHSKR